MRSARIARVVLAVVLSAGCAHQPASVGLVGASGGSAPPEVSLPASGLYQAVVTRVIDGDTVEVTLGGRTVDVRLIGIDTPETVAPGQPVECGGPQASRFTEASLEGESVELELDVERLDRYGRTLAYVWLHGRLFNEVLVDRGFAQVATYPPDVKYVDVFLAAERRARAADLGLWGWCAGSSGSA